MKGCRKLKDSVLLIGYDSAGRCCYLDLKAVSAFKSHASLTIGHRRFGRMKIRRLAGFIFDSAGRLVSEFEDRLEGEPVRLPANG
ncbi:hypothetical protein OpiT1DRAFT_03363 [Opitutaceae bacterium TAV1]|nr:hypothetical protein OpiT1DRAFT_03363 [Opitutaceae bacterium TAV1]